MRTCLYGYVNREYEQHLIDLITSFVEGNAVFGNELLGLNIFITKRRHIGQIYLNIQYDMGDYTLTRRKYFNRSFWRATYGKSHMGLRIRTHTPVDYRLRAW